MTRETTALVGAVFGLSPAVLFAAWRWWPQPRRRSAEPGLVTQAYRYCPTELRTRAAVLHPDGTATCGNCGTHIPAGDS